MGYPKFDTDILMTYLHQPIQKILNVSGLSEDKQQLYLITPIRNLVDLIHLIPASESHHHRDCGGLIIHSLEVAYKANQIARDRYFPDDRNENDKSSYQLKWILACTLCGLCHDAGKVLTDCIVRQELHGEIFQPLIMPLTKWMMLRPDKGQYIVTWNGSRIDHENALGRFFDRLIPLYVLEYLGENIVKAVTCFFFNELKSDHILKEIISAADSYSTASNQKVGVFNRSQIGTQVDRDCENFFASLRRLVQLGNKSLILHHGLIVPENVNGVEITGWSINMEESAVWYCNTKAQKLFVAMDALEEIHHILKAMNVHIGPDILRFGSEAERNSEVTLSLLDDLFNHGYLLQRPYSENQPKSTVHDSKFKDYIWQIGRYFSDDPDKDSKMFKAICLNQSAINQIL